jgi:hypothetical protein
MYFKYPSMRTESTLNKFGDWKYDLKSGSKLAPVAHTCNPSYSEGRDQEDRGSKPALANSLQDPISKKKKKKKTFTKKGRWSGSRYRPWVQTPVLKKKKLVVNNFSSVKIFLK